MSKPRASSIIEQAGTENLEALADLTKKVTDRVARDVLRWRVGDGVEDLVGLIVMHTCIVASREMGLGELAAELQAARASGSGDWEWAVRTRGPRGDRIAVMRDEAAARDYANPPTEGVYSYTVMRRQPGQWEEAPDA